MLLDPGNTTPTHRWSHIPTGHAPAPNCSYLTSCIIYTNSAPPPFKPPPTAQSSPVAQSPLIVQKSPIIDHPLSVTNCSRAIHFLLLHTNQTLHAFRLTVLKFQNSPYTPQCRPNPSGFIHLSQIVKLFYLLAK